VAGRSARGYGADGGVIYRYNPRLRFGATLRNAIQPGYSFSSEKEVFPRILRTGAAATFYDGQMTVALDMDKTVGVSQSPKYHLGVEGYAIPNIIFRAGINSDEITAGLGIKWRTMQLDYSAGFDDVGLVTRVAFRTYFGGYE